MRRAPGREALQEPRRRGHVAAFAEHGLDDHRRSLGRRRLRGEQVVEPRERARRPRPRCRGRERVGERRHEHARRERRVPGAVARLRRRHRHRQVRAAVEAAGEHDHVRSARSPAWRASPRPRWPPHPSSRRRTCRCSPGVISARRSAERLEQVVVVAVHLGVDERASLLLRSRRRPSGGSGRSTRDRDAAAVKSRYSTPSVVVTQHPLPDATSRSVTENHTSER